MVGPGTGTGRRFLSDLRLLLLFRICRSIAAGIIALSFPYLVLSLLGYSPLMLGLLYTVGSAATAFLGLGFGLLADTWGRKPTLVIVGLLLPVSSLLVYVAPKAGLLFAAAALGGYSATGSLAGGGVGGAGQPIMSAALAELTTPESRTFYFALFTFASGLSAAGGAMCAKLFATREAFLAAAGIGLAGVAFTLPIRLPAVSGDVRSLPSRRVIEKFTATGALNGFAQGLIAPFLIPFFILVYHVPKSRMSVYGFISGALAAGALLAAPLLKRRWGFVRSITITRGTGAVLLTLLPVSPLFAIAVAIYLAAPALRVAALPVQQATLTEWVGEEELGRALGINQVARLAASSAAISLAGYLLHSQYIGLPFYLYGGITAISIYLYFRLFQSVEVRASRTPPGRSARGEENR